MNIDSTRQGKWVVRKSACGYEYGVWRKTSVPEIHKQFLECVVYLYPSRKAADAGARVGGTGFLISYPSEVENYHYYAVTNKHIIEEANSPVIRLNTKSGRTDVLEYAEDDWFSHPDGDDVSVCPIKLPLAAYKNNALNWNLVALPERFISAQTHIGAEVFMVGRFINQEGKQQNTPAARFGNIAMIPDGRIELEEGREEELIFVEMRSQGGYSGSPAFLALPERPYEPNSINPFPAPIPYSHIWLLGVDCGHILDTEPVMIPSLDPDKQDKTHPQGWYVSTNTNMSAVIPAWRIGKLLENHEDLKMQRKTEDERRLEEQERQERRPRFRRDAVKPTSEGEITREGFEEALRRASRKIPSDDEEKSEP